MADLYSKNDELGVYLESLRVGKDAIIKSRNPPEPTPPFDLEAWKLSFRNQVVAGSGFKAKFFGTSSTEPEVTEQTLKDLGLDDDKAKAIISERDRIRAAAIALTR